MKIKLGYCFLSGAILLCQLAGCTAENRAQASSESQGSSSMAQTTSADEYSYSAEYNTSSSSSIDELPEDWMPYSPEEYLAPELPPLTEEELARVDEPVAQEVWDSLNTGGMVLSIPHPNQQYPEDKSLRLDEWVRRCLKKLNKEITYGELWRLNNAGEKLFIGSNVPNEYPEALKNLKSIKSIRIRPNFVNPFDPATDVSNLVAMTWLEELHIDGGSRHEFFVFPTKLSKLTHLKKLNLESCLITELPDIFDSFPELEVLNLNLNYITELPPSVYRCKNLRILNLEKTNYTIVPPQISQFKVLEELYLPCPVNQLADEICTLSNLKVLEFGFPLYTRDVPLVLDYDSMIHSLPQQIGNLKKLEVLRIYGPFPITELPESITDCESLTTISASSVEVKPENMDKLKNLKHCVLG